MVSKKTKTRYFEINVAKRGFVSKLIGEKKNHDFSDLNLLRNLLTKQKANILYVLKHKEFESIYELAKHIKRDLKSVRTDMKMLERFGFIEFSSHKKNNRNLLRPILTTEKMELILSI